MEPTNADIPRTRRSRIVRWGVPAVIAIALIIWLATGFYTVQTNERGVVLRFGAVHAKVQPGIHYAWPWPIDTVYVVATTDVKRIEVGFRLRGDLMPEARQSDMLTGDENLLKIETAVQYKIRDPVAYLFRAESPQWFVERTVESALAERIASEPVDGVLTTDKAEILNDVTEMAQARLDAYACGLRIVSVNMKEVSPPVPVIAAFKEVASAKKDSERMIDEAHADAARVIPQANGEAQQIVKEAEGVYADRVNTARGDASRFLSVLAEYEKKKAITRYRLFVESMESVMSAAKLIIVPPADSEGPSNVTVVE